jgi:dTDP-glucose 4,6-dehydratase
MSPANRLPRQDLQLILERTAPLWEEVRGHRIFVTGGTGFFGCWLVESFCYINEALALGATMVVLTREPAAFAAKCPHLAANPGVALHCGDVRTFTFPEGKFEYVLHAATDASTRAATEDPQNTRSTIVEGTEHTLQFASASGVMKFLLTSSGAVYGKQPPEVTHLSENYIGSLDPVAPVNVYGESKRAAERLCSTYRARARFGCKIARCWAFCGPHLPLDQHFAIGNFIGDVLAGRPIQILGDGTPRRSYLYAADLAVWLWTMLFRAPALVPFNVGSAHDVSILELAHTVAATLNPKTEILVAQQAVRRTAPIRYVPCVDRAREVLGLRQSIGLEESIRRTAEWYGQQTKRPVEQTQ